MKNRLPDSGTNIRLRSVEFTGISGSHPGTVMLSEAFHLLFVLEGRWRSGRIGLAIGMVFVMGHLSLTDMEARSADTGTKVTEDGFQTRMKEINVHRNSLLHIEK